MMSPKKLSNMIKSITAREIFRLHQKKSNFLWGENFGQADIMSIQLDKYVNEDVIRKYVQNQGSSQKYQKIHKAQLRLF